MGYLPIYDFKIFPFHTLRWIWVKEWPDIALSRALPIRLLHLMPVLPPPHQCAMPHSRYFAQPTCVIDTRLFYYANIIILHSHVVVTTIYFNIVALIFTS